MSAARDQSGELPVIGRRPRTPESDLREKLLREVMHKNVDLAGLRDGWDGQGSKAPTAAVLHRVADLGLMIVGASFPMPHAINMNANADGFVLFTLFGAQGRQVDAWVEDDSGEFHYVATQGDEDVADGRLPIANFARTAEWLAGRSQYP